MMGARRRSVAPPDGPTFDREVVRILQQNCQSCHHPDDIAPFSLMTYHDAVLHADAVKYMTQTRQMPPWKPAPGCGDFVGERALTQSDIDTIAHWVDGGTQESRTSSCRWRKPSRRRPRKTSTAASPSPATQRKTCRWR
jgi:hypothetical protein